MSEATTQAQYLFEKYIGVGAVDLLRSLPTLPEKTFENDWLDFKSGKVRNEDVKGIWSKIIGAFANNSGGVVVWGLIAKKDTATGIDAVSGIELVPDVFALKSRLMELRHGANDPPVANIEIKELQISNGKPEGFVVCHIPESSTKPHRSEFFERRFFLRMGDSSRECSVSLLRQLFYPKINHRIEVEIQTLQLPKISPMRLTQTPQQGSHIRFALRIGFRNTGETSIDEVQARIECSEFKLFSYQWSNALQKYGVPEPLQAVESFGSVIHPTVKYCKNILLLSVKPQPPTDFQIKVYARDMLPRKATIRFNEKVGEAVSVECLP